MVVVFTKNNARIVKTTEFKKYKKYQGCYIDPDLSEVRGVPPHYWKKVNHNIVEMTPPEKHLRDVVLKLGKADNDIDLTKRPLRLDYIRKMNWIRRGLFLFSFLSGLGIGAYFG